MEKLGLPSLMDRDIALIKQHDSLDYSEISSRNARVLFTAV